MIARLLSDPSGALLTNWLAVFPRTRFVKGPKGVLGPVKDFWYRFDEQGRGSLHVHLLLWIDKPQIDRDEGFDDNYCTPTTLLHLRGKMFLL